MLNISGLLQAQFSLYQGVSDNSFLRVKLAAADRLQSEMDQINAKYDGVKGAQYEQQMTQLSDQKVELATYARYVQSALDRTPDIKVQFGAMADAVRTGSSEAWDYALKNMQYYAGSRALDNTCLSGSSRTAGEGFSEKTTIVTAGGLDANLNTHDIGADYTIVLDDGTLLRPDQDSNSLKDGKGGQLSFANLSLSNITDSDQVTFTDSATGKTYTGQLHRGGNGMLNAWLYNNFDAAGAARAKADLQTANHLVGKAEQDWNVAADQIAAMVSKVGNQFNDARGSYEKVQTEELDAKSAEITAAQTRFETQMNLLQITRGNATDMIQRMFMTETFTAKSSIYDIMSGA